MIFCSVMHNLCEFNASFVNSVENWRQQFCGLCHRRGLQMLKIKVTWFRLIKKSHIKINKSFASYTWNYKIKIAITIDLLKVHYTSIFHQIAFLPKL